MGRALGIASVNSLLEDLGSIDDFLPRNVAVSGLGYGDRQVAARAAKIGDEVVLERDYENLVAVTIWHAWGTRWSMGCVRGVFRNCRVFWLWFARGSRATGFSVTVLDFFCVGSISYLSERKGLAWP